MWRSQSLAWLSSSSESNRLEPPPPPPPSSHHHHHSQRSLHWEVIIDHFIAIMAEPQTLLSDQPATVNVLCRPVLICYIYHAWRQGHSHAWERTCASTQCRTNALLMTASRSYFQGTGSNHPTPAEQIFHLMETSRVTWHGSPSLTCLICASFGSQ